MTCVAIEFYSEQVGFTIYLTKLKRNINYLIRKSICMRCYNVLAYSILSAQQLGGLTMKRVLAKSGRLHRQ